MSNKAISNSNPEIHVQNGSSQASEPILVGSANQMIRFVCSALVILVLMLGYFKIEDQKMLVAQSEKIGILQEKVSLLEDIVINKHLTIGKD